MSKEIRASDGKKLFEWTPYNKTMTIVVRNKIYTVKLVTDGPVPDFRVIDEVKKNK